MKRNINLYHVDAFCDGPFSGNPAAVIVLDSWPDKQWMQNIALENQLSETAFLVPEGEGFRIRWFTPVVEVDLCGHATLASAAVLWEYYGFSGEFLILQSQSGPLYVSRSENGYTLDFPADDIKQTEIDERLHAAVGEEPLEQWVGKSDIMMVFDNELQIRSMTPDFSSLSKLVPRGLIVTAPGDSVDFVSRFFCPNVGMDEDPATGSAHTTLTPYWASNLGVNEMSARQLSSRGARFFCEVRDDRVLISGKVSFYSKGIIL